MFFVAFGFLGVLLISWYFTDRHYLSSEGIRYNRLFGLAHDFMPWSAARKVTYSSMWRWFVLEDADGKKARISVMFMGLPEFAEHVLKYVPQEAVEPKVREMLRQIAGGHLPEVWG